MTTGKTFVHLSRNQQGRKFCGITSEIFFRGVLPEFRLQQPTVAQTASSVLSAAGSESTVVADDATGDDTVIIMEYNEANDDTTGPSKRDDGDQQ